MIDQFFRQEGQTNTFGFNQMRRELNHLQNQPLAPLHSQTPPPGIPCPDTLLTVRMDERVQ